MIRIQALPMNMLGENCYVVSDDTREAVVIDCGALGEDDTKSLTRYVEDNQLHVTRHLCTHAHYDHCFGAAFMNATFGTPPEFCAADEPIYYGKGSEIFGGLCAFMRKESLPSPARFLKDGDSISFGDHTLEVIATPGHTPGGVCFYCAAEKVVFVGDTLFYCSVGRTDFEDGDGELLIRSIRQKLFVLPDDVKAYPGHGPQTNIGFEKRNNPYV